MKLVVEHARIVDPASGRDMSGAVLIEDGKISDIVEGIAPGMPADGECLDAGGLVLAPGLIDLRVFTGEPGREYRETLASAGAAAAAGGITSFLVMPDTSPAVDDAALVDFILRRAAATTPVRVFPAAAITGGIKGQELTEFGLLREAGAVCFSDGRGSLQDSALIRAAFTYAANFDMPVVHQPLDAALAGDGVMNEGVFASGLGLRGIPNEAETVPLARDLQLAALTGVRYHAAQISCAGSVELMAAAKRRSRRVSCGVSINNLSLNENDIGPYRTFYKLSPPLRSEDDRQALIAGLRDGTVDTIHSDHDPQDSETKRQPFAEAANGAIGLESMLAAALRLVHSGEVDLMTLLRAMTSRPAEFLRLPTGRIEKGAPADLIVLDLDYPWTVEESGLVSRSRNTTFEGARMTGRVMHTFVGGKLVYSHPATSAPSP